MQDFPKFSKISLTKPEKWGIIFHKGEETMRKIGFLAMLIFPSILPAFAQAAALPAGNGFPAAPAQRRKGWE